MTTDEGSTRAYDKLHVFLQSPPGQDISTHFQIDNTWPRNSWQELRLGISNLSWWANRPIWVVITATTDVSLPTSFFVDDLSFVPLCTVYAPPPGPTATASPLATLFSPLPTPTDTPIPTTDWTFSGDVTTSAPAQPIPGAGVTLYRLAASGWQGVATTMTGSDGRFRLGYSGPPDPAWFLLLVQYPSGYTPAHAQAGAYFLVLPNQMVLAAQPLSPGVYGGHQFVGQWHANATPLPGTLTPPPLPPPWPPPTIMSPLATPRPQ